MRLRLITIYSWIIEYIAYVIGHLIIFQKSSFFIQIIFQMKIYEKFHIFNVISLCIRFNWEKSRVEMLWIEFIYSNMWFKRYVLVLMFFVKCHSSLWQHLMTTLPVRWRKLFHFINKINYFYFTFRVLEINLGRFKTSQNLEFNRIIRVIYSTVEVNGVLKKKSLTIWNKEFQNSKMGNNVFKLSCRDFFWSFNYSGFFSFLKFKQKKNDFKGKFSWLTLASCKSCK